LPTPPICSIRPLASESYLTYQADRNCKFDFLPLANISHDFNVLRQIKELFDVHSIQNGFKLSIKILRDLDT
jgi:hypothetical protein